jgi:TonB family protein
MDTAPAPARLMEYPPDDLRVGRGFLISVSLHFGTAALICLILYIMGIVSLKQLLEKGGAIASSGPAPQQMIIELKLDDIKPPPTDHIEFIKQILKPKPVVVIKPPPPPPKPVPKPVVRQQPRYTAPNATGQGVSKIVSSFVLGSSGLPAPGYPYEARVAHESGEVLMHVVFDAGGGIASAEVTKSCGYSNLDTSTRDFINENWKNSSMANKTVDVPIVYDPSGAVH